MTQDATTPAPAPAPARPKLEICLAQFSEANALLNETYLSYQVVKNLRDEIIADPTKECSLGMSLHIGDVPVPVPAPADPQARRIVVEDALSFLGQEVVRLWNVAHSVTTEATGHCNAAVQNAAQQGGGT